MKLHGRYMMKKAISFTYDKYVGHDDSMNKEATDKLIQKGNQMMNDPTYCYIQGKRYRRDEVDKLIEKGKKKLGIK